MDINHLFTRNYWIETTGSEFNFGFFSALALVTAIALVLFLLLIAFWWLIRCRRAGEIVVPQKDGEVVITRDAVSQAVVEALTKESIFSLRKLRIHCCRKHYGLTLYCHMRSSGDMEKIIPESKKLILETLKNNFSISNISGVRIVIEKLTQVYMPESSSPTPECEPEKQPESEPVHAEVVPDVEKTDSGVK